MDQPYVEGAGLYLRLQLSVGWGLLVVRFILVLWIRHVRVRFLRKHGGITDERSLEERLRELAAIESVKRGADAESALAAVRKSIGTHDFESADANGDGIIDKNEFKKEQSRRRLQAAAQHSTLGPQGSRHNAVNMFDEVKHKQLKRQKHIEVCRARSPSRAQPHGCGSHHHRRRHHDAIAAGA